MNRQLRPSSEPLWDPHGNESQAPRQVPPGPACRCRVLLAEDTPAGRLLVAHVLGSRGYHVEMAQGGREALELLGNRDFDVVVMDVQMPGMDGLAAAAAIRNLDDPRKARVPIIALTAHDLHADEERCRAAGMDAYLSKPIDGKKLLELIEGFMNSRGEDGRPSRTRSEGPSGIASAPEADRGFPAPDPHSPAAFHREEAIVRCFGDPFIFQKMAAYLLAEAPRLLEQMRAAIRQGDCEALGRAAHRLKGTLVHLAADPAENVVQGLEQAAFQGDLASAAERLELLKSEVERLTRALTPCACSPHP